MKKIIFTSFLFLLIFLLGLVIPNLRASATVGVVSGFVSERQSVYITFVHEDAFPFPILISQFWQNIDALDYVFNQLHQEGKLNKKYPTLSIVANQFSQLEHPRWHSPTVLSMEENCFVDWDGHNIRTNEVIELGSCYKIFVTTHPISYENLLTLILLLPRLTPENPRIEIETLEAFKQYKQEVALEKERFRNITFERDISWSPCGQFFLQGTWRNQKLHYQIINFETREKINLDALEYYLVPPAWSFNSRFVVYGSQEKIKIFDLANNQKTVIDLRQLHSKELKPEYYKNIDRITFSVTPAEDKILFDLSGWKFDFDGVTYIWDSQTELFEEQILDLPWRRVFEDWIEIPVEVKRVTLDQFETMTKEEPDEELKKLEPYRSRILEKHESFYGGEISPLKNKIALITSEDDLLKVKMVEIDNFKEINIDQFAPVAINRVLGLLEPVVDEPVIDKVVVDEDEMVVDEVMPEEEAEVDEVAKADEKANWLLILIGVVSIIAAIFIGLLIYKKKKQKQKDKK